ncbi:DUF4389 domain-containing protein [Rhodovulum sulfidophilum]|uniref:DUF4389 domain-containing protein n=1 Tax=Rhodovulum sulfidophilum TaxID=35806 RepID=UPI001921C036|nr:DUF4389 domain-containing protein [Rhodovulum sulfidophilum]MBL3595179.1 DUF4389 domain-containing protein [Rhodovulum sulfidophilum]
MTDTNSTLNEGAQASDAQDRGYRPALIRGAWMLLMLALFYAAQMIMIIAAILQFGWLLFAKEENERIAEFGDKLANWMAIAARYLTVAGDAKPFPWTDWK